MSVTSIPFVLRATSLTITQTSHLGLDSQLEFCQPETLFGKTSDKKSQVTV